MKDHHSENELALLNRLLERLHQADYKVLGSIEINVYVRGREGKEGYREGKEGREEMPEALRTEAAMVLWEKVQAAGYVDEHYQPLLSRTQAAILADEMAGRLGIKEKWKVFETLWQRKNMYKDYYRAMDQRQSLHFKDCLKQLFK